MRFGGSHDIPVGWRGAHYRQALLRFVDRIYANSTAVRDHLLRTLPGLSSERVHIVWNAIPVGSAEPARIRAEIGLAHGIPLIAAVGGLAKRKGFDVLIRSLAASDTDAHLVICGEGSERGALGELAGALGIAGRVHMPGQRDDVPGVLAAADVFVLSSRMEGFSVALLEAMRAALPIIATDVGGVRDALCDGQGNARAGWIVPPDDVPSLAGALRDLLASLDSPATRTRTAEARRRATDDYTVERMVDGVEQVLLAAPQVIRRRVAPEPR
jgi:glycosyltransferase involved in cell wall biosynthesis